MVKAFLLSLSFFGMVTSGCLAKGLPTGFVYLHQLDSTISEKLLFATDENFVGAPLDKYNGNQVICTRKAALALMKAQKALRKTNPHWSLQVADAYRPASAVGHIQRWAKDLTDQKTKEKYYPDIDKEDLLGAFLAAKRSSHSRGSTFDVVIIDTRTNEQLDYGPEFFGDYAHSDYPDLTHDQRQNRLFLRKLMKAHGFKPYDKEFWHFTLIDEPFPKSYFDFEICNAIE